VVQGYSVPSSSLRCNLDTCWGAYTILSDRATQIPGIQSRGYHRPFPIADDTELVCAAVVSIPREPMKKPNKCMLVPMPQNGTEDYLIIPTGSDGSFERLLICLFNSSLAYQHASLEAEFQYRRVFLHRDSLSAL